MSDSEEDMPLARLRNRNNKNKENGSSDSDSDLDTPLARIANQSHKKRNDKKKKKDKENAIPVVEELEINEIAEDEDLYNILPALENDLNGNGPIDVLNLRHVHLQGSWRAAPLMAN